MYISINDHNIPTSFAGANTGGGFVSFYDKIFPESDLDGLYIIKGGSGTGKSTFMRRLGEEAVKSGHSCEHYLCGSDESSLDGIIVKGKRGGKVGVIDGTPPHPRELRSPGAAGDILNFGVFWNSQELRTRRREIDGLNRKKSMCYETAYRYLGAAERIDRHIDALCREIYLSDKGTGIAVNLLQSIGAHGKKADRQLSGITATGVVRLMPDYNNVREYTVAGNADIARMFMADMEKIITDRRYSAEICRDPLDLRHIDGIYFPESRVWLHTGDGKDEAPEKIIHTRRFTHIETASANRQKLRFGKKCRDSLTEGAIEALAEARRYHSEIEEIYKEHMDYDALNTKSKEWIGEILACLDR